MKLSQFDLIQTPTGNTTKTVNKGEFIVFLFIKNVLKLMFGMYWRSTFVYRLVFLDTSLEYIMVVSASLKKK